MPRPEWTEWNRAPMWARWVGWNDDGNHRFYLFDPSEWHDWQHVRPRAK